MRSFEQFLQDYGVRNLCEAQVDNTVQNDDQPKLRRVEHIVLIGEKRYRSMRKQNIKLSYADPTKLEYTISHGKINVNDGEYKFSLTYTDSENTIVIVRSGYKNPVVSFLLKEIENFGITVLNNPEQVAVSNNKYLTALLLDKYNIPQPKYTMVTKSDISKDDHSKLDKKLKSIYKQANDESKYVCKILNGHGGKGVFVCTGSNILSVLQTLFAIDDKTNILVQEFLEIKDGDVRVNVLTLNGKQEILDVTMRSKDTEDFRTNLSLGNSTKEYELTPEQEDLVKLAAEASGLVWAGVDLLPLSNGKNVIIEINGAPGTPNEINNDNLEQANFEFFKKFINVMNSLC
jgi:glutathione synthase/RimK-type ligase-like ATP-grasp enzyme